MAQYQDQRRALVNSHDPLGSIKHGKFIDQLSDY
jgi:hypothetical protein